MKKSKDFTLTVSGETPMKEVCTKITELIADLTAFLICEKEGKEIEEIVAMNQCFIPAEVKEEFLQLVTLKFFSDYAE